jgi:hypothetical protein
MTKEPAHLIKRQAHLERIDSDQANYLISSYPLATAHARK